MKLAISLNDFFLKKEEKIKAYTILHRQNVDRIIIFALLAIPVSLAHIVIFYLNLDTTPGVTYQWQINIIKAHTLIITILTLSLSFFYFTKKTKIGSSIYSTYLTHFSFIFLLSIGAVIANIDQMVTSAINPYFLVCILTPIVITLPLIHTLIYYILSYFIFIIISPFFQYDANILLSNRANAISAVGFGLILATYLWRINVTRFRHTQLIEEQKTQLETQNTRLLLLSEELKKINESNDRFFSILAHDLRSPMNGFLGITNLLAEEYESFSETQIREMATALRESATNIFRLLDNLLDWSKVQRGFITFNPEILNLSEIATNTIQYFLIQCKEKGIALNIRIPNDTLIFSDKHMLEVIFRNLISNALKFTPKGGEIEVFSSPLPNGFVSFGIKDTGVGMSSKIINSLFCITETISRPGTLGEPSTGLGLVLCKEFVDKHSGTIEVESEIGKGSTFIIIFPPKSA